MELEGSDGTSTKINRMGVTDSGLGKVLAFTVPDLEIASVNGQLWNVDFNMVPVGAANVMYIKNTSDKNEMHITDMEVVGSVNGWVKIFKVVSITDPTGTLVTVKGKNRSAFFDRSPSTNIYTSASIGALTLDSESMQVINLQANAPRLFRIDSHIQIPPGRAIAISCSAAMTINGSLTIYEE